MGKNLKRRARLLAIILSVILASPLQLISAVYAVDGDDADAGKAQVEETAKEEKKEEAEAPKEEPKPEAKPAVQEAPKEEKPEEPAAAPEAQVQEVKEPEKKEEAPGTGEAEAGPAKEEKKIEEEQEDEKDKEEEEKYPAQTLTANAGGVTVTLKAPEGALPKGAKLKAARVGGQYIKAVEKKLEAQGRSLSDAVAVDVTPFDKDGKEIQPKKAVSVSFSGTGLDLEKGDDVDVWRVSDDASSVTDMGGSGNANSASFRTNHFTIYVSGGSSTDPVGQTSGNPYVLAYGQNVTLAATESHYTWASGNTNVVRVQRNSNTSATATNRNSGNSEVLVRVTHGSSQSEEFWILAQPNVPSYTVTFKLKDAGASTFDTEKEGPVTQGGTAVPPDEASTKKVDGVEYTFDGWYEDEACTQEATLTNIRSNKTFYAKYDPTGYDVTFKLKDAGQTSFVNEKEETVASGGAATAPDEDAEKTVGGKKYEFDGWYEDEDCTQDATLTGITEPKTFYAQYKLMKHTVTYMFKDAGGSSFQKEHEEEVDSGSAAAETPEHEDEKTAGGKTYKFSGWCLDEACTAPATLTNITDDTTVYAKYTVLVTLKYDKNSTPDDATVPAAVTAPAGSKVILGTASRENYGFVNWNTEAEGGGDAKYPNTEFTLPEDDITLYAQWEQSFVHVIYYNNYEGAQEEVFHTDDNVAENNAHYHIIADMPTRSNYLFSGWSTSAGGAAQYGPKENCPTGTTDLKLYATWVRYNPDHLDRDALTAHGMTVPYNGSEYTIEDVEEMDTGRDYRKYGEAGFVRVGDTDQGSGVYHHIYANINPIKASGTDAGSYDTPITAALYTHNDDTKEFDPLDEGIEITNYTLTITPAELKIKTNSDEKLWDGEPLTAGGYAKVGNGEWQAFTHEGSMIELVNGEKVKIRTTSSQTDKGSTTNDYEVDWDQSTGGAKANNYKLTTESLGTLTVDMNKVTYDANAGGETVDDMPYPLTEECGETYTLSDSRPRRQHYDFKNWNTQSGAGGDYYNPGDGYIFPDDVHEVTFYAIWEPKAVNISYDPNGGTYDGTENPTTVTHHYLDKIKVGEGKDAEREGYRFNSWEEIDGNRYQPGDEYEVTDATMFIAIWDIPITYDPNGGEFRGSTDPTVEYYEENSGVTIAEEAERKHFRFVEWNTKKDGTGDKYEPGYETEFGEPMTFYAIWEEIPIDVTFDPNGGTLEGKTEPVVEKHVSGEEFPMMSEPSRDHYKFIEWNTEKDGSGDGYKAGEKITLDDDETFYAIWEIEKHKLTFDPNGGTFRESTDPTVIEYDYGETITIPEAPERDGYTFLYWKGSEFQPGDKYTVEDDHLFVAQWKKDEEPEPEPEPEPDPDDPDDEDEDDADTNDEEEDEEDTEEPRTGDTENAGLWIMLMTAALIALIPASKKRDR